MQRGAFVSTADPGLPADIGSSVPQAASRSVGVIALSALCFVLTVNLYGSESLVQSVGPMIAIALLLVAPVLVFYPYVLMVSELSCAIPCRAGAVRWASVVCPPFATYTFAIWTVLLNVLDLSMGVLAFTNYLDVAMAPQRLAPGWLAVLRIALVLVCVLVNVAGPTLLSRAAILACVMSVLPFLLLLGLQIPQGLSPDGFNWQPSKVAPQADGASLLVPNTDWSAAFIMLGAFYAGLESIGTLVLTIEHPEKAITRAFIATATVGFTALTAGIVAIAGSSRAQALPDRWGAGFFYQASVAIGGRFLGTMFFVGLSFNTLAFLIASILSASHGLAGMGEMNVFPDRVSSWLAVMRPTPCDVDRLCAGGASSSDIANSEASRNPAVPSLIPAHALALLAVLASVVAVNLNFATVLALDQILVSARMLLIVATFVSLRQMYPSMPRPFKAWRIDRETAITEGGTRGGSTELGPLRSRTDAAAEGDETSAGGQATYRHSRWMWIAAVVVSTFPLGTIALAASSASGSFFLVLLGLLGLPVLLGAAIERVLGRTWNEHPMEALCAARKAAQCAS